MQQRPQEHSMTQEEYNHIDTAFFGHPKPLSSLCFTEMWERFSFYGIQPLLILYMVAVMNEGGLDLTKKLPEPLLACFQAPYIWRRCPVAGLPITG